jgi:hypothetical protein
MVYAMEVQMLRIVFLFELSGGAGGENLTGLSSCRKIERLGLSFGPET